MNSLTIAYCTARRDPKIEWFFDSLSRQSGSDFMNVIVVSRLSLSPEFDDTTMVVTKPKPNVWQGEHRLTKEDWWAMANARNTALCLCKTDYIVYVDDLSVLMPGWLDAVREAMAGNYVVCGAYRKVEDLVVENGEVKYFTAYSDDTRLGLAPDTVGPCTGDWLYGCSCGFPLESLLTVGGWPEFCDGLGSEDTTLGIVLANAGFHLKYDKRMMTYEAEDLHGTTWDGDKKIVTTLRRTDKGVSPNDKSHAIVDIARQSKYFPNYYLGGMRALRERMLNGGEWPTDQVPQNDWYDGQMIDEME